MDLFRELDGLDAIRLSGTEAQGWYVEEARAAMEAGEILYAGKYSAPDYERIYAEGCDLAVESTMIYHTPEVKEQLEGAWASRRWWSAPAMRATPWGAWSG